MAEKHKEQNRLALDAAAAREAGMSYGYWKAVNKSSEKIEKRIPEGWLECPHCGWIFKPVNGKQVYCQVYCQREAYRKKYQQKRNKYQREWRERKRAAAVE